MTQREELELLDSSLSSLPCGSAHQENQLEPSLKTLTGKSFKQTKADGF
jgi:hypothetical protein